jgi:lipopolysaccharide export system protein LptA
VKIINPEYTITSDTLMHNLNSKISNFYGPTEIISDSNYIYCENGWYDHQNDISQFNENAFLESKEHSIRGDSLYYDRENGIGRAYKNVIIKDTVQDLLLFGNHGEFFEKTERSLMTDKALFVQIYEQDSIFLHADTLRSHVDTSYTEFDTTAYRIVRAYNKVKLYNTGFQSQCDSLVYTMLDSVIQMYYEPVLWTEENQLTALFIKMKIIDNEIRRIDMTDSTFIISQKDSIRFDQISGQEMVGYVENNELYQIDVSGETNTIYFIEDEDILMGINKVTSNSMVIYLEDNQVNKIWFYTKPKGVIYPPFSLSDSELYLAGFKWLDEYRPKCKEDVFNWKMVKIEENPIDILPENINLEEGVKQ